MKAFVSTAVVATVFICCASAAPAASKSPSSNSAQGAAQQYIGDVNIDQFSDYTCSANDALIKGSKLPYVSIDENIFNTVGGLAACGKLCVSFPSIPNFKGIVVGGCQGCGTNGTYLQESVVPELNPEKNDWIYDIEWTLGNC